MTLIAIGLIVLLFAIQGSHMVTMASVTLMIVVFVVAVLIDIVMFFGPDADPGGDRLLRYRPKLNKRAYNRWGGVRQPSAVGENPSHSAAGTGSPSTSRVTGAPPGQGADGLPQQ